jgi:hypothetical protein
MYRLILISLALIGFSGTIFNSLPKEVKPNQVWRRIDNNDNLFEKPIIFDTKVINVKNGYVQYISINRNVDLDTLTSKENTFRFDNKCIANCK